MMNLLKIKSFKASVFHLKFCSNAFTRFSSLSKEAKRDLRHSEQKQHLVEEKLKSYYALDELKAVYNFITKQSQKGIIKDPLVYKYGFIFIAAQMIGGSFFYSSANAVNVLMKYSLVINSINVGMIIGAKADAIEKDLTYKSPLSSDIFQKSVFSILRSFLFVSGALIIPSAPVFALCYTGLVLETLNLSHLVKIAFTGFDIKEKKYEVLGANYSTQLSFYHIIAALVGAMIACFNWQDQKNYQRVGITSNKLVQSLQLSRTDYLDTYNTLEKELPALYVRKITAKAEARYSDIIDAENLTKDAAQAASK